MTSPATEDSRRIAHLLNKHEQDKVSLSEGIKDLPFADAVEYLIIYLSSTPYGQIRNDIDELETCKLILIAKNKSHGFEVKYNEDPVRYAEEFIQALVVAKTA